MTMLFDIIEDGDVVSTRSVDRDIVKIGTLGSCHLKFDDSSVSRVHARIEKDGDEWTLMDLGSARGTKVNGEEVDETVIEEGDELQFGDIVVRLRFGEAAEGTVAGDGTITTPEGRQVKPYTMEGYYDDAGNYIPGYYDEHGEYHLGYGYVDDNDEWVVTHGYYDPSGEWVPTDGPVKSGADAGGTSWADRPKDRDEYTESFFQEKGGDTLEIAHLWGDHVLMVESFPSPRTVTIGPSKDEDFIVGKDLTDSKRPLVLFDESGNEYGLVVTSEMTGHLEVDGEALTLQEAIDGGLTRSAPGVDGQVLALTPRTSARIEWRDNVFLFHFTSMPKGVGTSFGVDTQAIPYFAISAALHIALLIMAMSMPGNAGDLSLERLDEDDRFVEMMLKPKEEEKKDSFFDKGDEEQAAKAKGEETKAGKESAEQTNKEMAIKGPPDNADPKVRKEYNKKVAMNAGINKVFQSEGVSSMFGSASESVGSDAIHALGNMQGASKGDAKGFGGLGLSGAGRGGGGGMSEEGLGIGRVGTAGRGGGGRGGKGYGEGAADMGDKGKTRPQVVPQRPDVTGSLDKEIIRRVVRQHRRELKFCYEQELQRNPELSGRVKVKWTISPSGDVISAIVTESTLGNRNVEQCMQGKIRRWVFPSPKGGGIVEVNYPFNFSSGG
jgi:TonB family protein